MPPCSELWSKSSEVYRNVPTPSQRVLNKILHAGGSGKLVMLSSQDLLNAS